MSKWCHGRNYFYWLELLAVFVLMLICNCKRITLWSSGPILPVDTVSFSLQRVSEKAELQVKVLKVLSVEKTLLIMQQEKNVMGSHKRTKCIQKSSLRVCKHFCSYGGYVFQLGMKVHNCHCVFFTRGPRVCKLWSHLHTSVEAWQHRTLPVQCLRAVPQDERTEQTSHQTQTQAGESRQCNNGRERISERVCVCVCGGGGSK